MTTRKEIVLKGLRGLRFDAHDSLRKYRMQAGGDPVSIDEEYMGSGRTLRQIIRDFEERLTEINDTIVWANTL